jgi:hypothetical protein
MTFARRQHWIPRLYLKAFAELDPAGGHRVWCIPTQDGEPYRTSIDNVAVEKWLYSPRNEAGVRSGDVEDVLSNLESAIAPLWRYFAKGDLIDLAHPPYRHIISLFVAGLHARHPKRIDDHREVRESLVKLLSKDLDDARTRPSSVEFQIEGIALDVPTAGWERYRDLDEEAIRLAFAQGVQSATKDLARSLMTKVWTVLEIKDPILVTSDAPVMLVNSNTTSPGFRTPGTVIMIPISPTRLLVMTDNVGNGSEYRWALDRMGPYANLTAWLTATKYLITSQDPPALIDALSTFLDREVPD